MEALEILCYKLKQPTDKIEQDTLQDLVVAVKKLNPVHKDISIISNEILMQLWNHLLRGFTKFDDQLLCSTTFYCILSKSDLNAFYLAEIDRVINDKEVQQKQLKQFHGVSLIYGLFQSSYFLNQTILEKNFSLLETLLKSAFKLLLSMTYEYSQYTFIVFKILTSFKKVLGTCMESVVFNKRNQIELLSMVNHNWENPITGVRNMNRAIFQMLISLLDETTYTLVVKEINMFYWNKAKYLMLSEIIEKNGNDVLKFVNENKWIEGLIGSLYKPGLVSAGTDMYFAILKRLKSETDWKELFLTNIIKVLCGNSEKPIEHFSNYWCLSTMKKFPFLLTLILQNIKDVEESDIKLYSKLSLLKHGSKLGIVKTNWSLVNDVEVKIIITNLRHCKPSIRMVAFEILCTSTDKCMPNQEIYDNVLQFLWENMNSDCTILRLSMLNNMLTFLTKLHILFINNFNNKSSAERTSLQLFCRDLQYLIVKSLNYEGNYQRKITTIRLTDMILKSFTEINQRKQKQLRNSTTTLNKFLNNNNNWYLHEKTFFRKLINLLKDPAKDIHETVSQVLLNYYIEDLCEVIVFESLIENAIQCINSKFFYEISCGQIMFKLITNILIKRNVEMRFKNVEDIFNFAYNILLDEYNTQNIVDSIENGKQLHSYINILHGTIKVCMQQGYKIKISNDIMFTLINILEHVSNQFAWEKESISSDFAKMNDMVQTLITDAGYNAENCEDETKISDLHQLVLNCLWLNVKASCELASLIIQYNIDVVNCEKCLYIITNVLETSRHKGAIEAAGVAIGDAIRYLTELPEDNNRSKIPFTLLQTKLNELIHEANKTSSVTRRGAGLSIMVHRIVSSDNSKGKPLFHYFMKLLLLTCNSDVKNDVPNVNKLDLPKAIYIHFLTRIVMDSSLASDTMFYATELGELAFKNLTDEHWQVRNAALQLYGALIPKLIGQKKACGIDDETMATVACDEFKTHFPTLWTYIVQRIKDQNRGDKIQTHSNLVPILNIIASLAKRYTFSHNLKEHDLNSISISLLQLLSSPIYAVRRLTAKALTNISTPNILDEILNINMSITENYLHGLLLLITNFDNHCNSVVIIKKIFKLNTNHSFLCRLYYEDVINKNTTCTEEDIKYIVNVMYCNSYAPGVHLWANKQIEKCINTISWNYMPNVLRSIMNCNNFDNCCVMIQRRMEHNESISETVLIEIAQILLNSEKSNSIIWEILYLISIKCRLHDNIDCTLIKIHLKDNNLYSKRFIIPLAARIFAKKVDNYSLIDIAHKIFKFSNPETSDVDMRYISAIANNELACDFLNLSDNIKIICIESVVLLLQDEDEDIRRVSSSFYNTLMKEKLTIQPFVCLTKILDNKFIRVVLDEPIKGTTQIQEELSKLIDVINSNKENQLNPFANESKNIYMEINMFKELLESLTYKNEIFL